jgi:hypothetical protein
MNATISATPSQNPMPTSIYGTRTPTPTSVATNNTIQSGTAATLSSARTMQIRPSPTAPTTIHLPVVMGVTGLAPAE